MKRIITIIIMAIGLLSAGWYHNYGTEHTDYGMFVKQVGESEYIIVGTTFNPHSPATVDSSGDVYVIKINENGDLLWTNQYGSDHMEGGFSALIDGDTILIEGLHSNWGITATMGNIYCLTINSSGEIIEEKVFGDSLSKCYDIERTPSGELVLFGCSYGPSGLAYQKVWGLSLNDTWDTVGYFSFLTDSTHTVVYPGNLSVFSQGILGIATAVDSTYETPHMNSTYGLVVGFSATMDDTLWTKIIRGELFSTSLNEIIKTNDDSAFAIVGTAYRFTSSMYLFEPYPHFTIISQSGDILVNRTIFTLSIMEGNSIKQLPSGDFVIAGTYRDADVGVIKIDMYGTVLWGNYLDFGRIEEINYLDLTDDGGFILVGSSRDDPNPAAERDVLVVKTDSLGNVSWVKQIPVRPQDMKISAYPNPFNSEISIEITLPENEYGEIEIYSLRGQLVRKLYSGELKSGVNYFKWDGKDNNGTPVSSGIYLVKTKASNGFSVSKEILLLK